MPASAFMGQCHAGAVKGFGKTPVLALYFTDNENLKIRSGASLYDERQANLLTTPY